MHVLKFRTVLALLAVTLAGGMISTPSALAAGRPNGSIVGAGQVSNQPNTKCLREFQIVGAGKMSAFGSTLAPVGSLWGNVTSGCTSGTLYGSAGFRNPVSGRFVYCNGRGPFTETVATLTASMSSTCIDGLGRSSPATIKATLVMVRETAIPPTPGVLGNWAGAAVGYITVT